MIVNLLQFLPLAFWAAVVFAALYSLLETKFRPLSVVIFAAARAIGVLRGRWRITAALFAVFASAPIAGAVAVRTLSLSGQSLFAAAIVWQGLGAALVAWIATAIHAHALKLPARTPAQQRRYVVASVAAGLAVFLITVAFALGLSYVIHVLWIAPRLRPGYVARLIQTLLYVPLSLVRPALSLGLRNPFGAAFRVAGASPFSIGVWVILLGLPSLAFGEAGADILRAHPSAFGPIGFAAAKALFSVVNCAWFETTTLFLMARKKRRLRLPRE